ncbi:hypothetical protein EC968_006708 [Mortierella alpina]|nr:hypothetical protein EC968_006708 [Mortierella alpina]
MAHGRDESANSCTMCGFNYVLKKRARFYELISYRGIRIAITVLLVLALLFPLGYVMKVCVLLSGFNDSPGAAPTTYLQTLRGISSDMEGMSVFPICKADSNRISLVRAMATPSRKAMGAHKPKSAGSGTTPPAPAIPSMPSHFVSLFPGPYAPHISHVNILAASAVSSKANPTAHASSPNSRHHQGGNKQGYSTNNSFLQGSWSWLAAGIDVVGSSHVANVLLYPFVNDRIWYFLLCRLQHLHLGFFLLGSASNVYMACKMLSDMYELVITPPHSRCIKNSFMAMTSLFVIWFWFSYNLMAFRVSATEEEFLSELPLWALRWINVGVAIVDLSYRRIYNRLGRLKVEEELLDISDVEKVEEMQQEAWLHQQQSFLQFSHEQGQYLLGQFKALEVKQSILNGANAAVDAVSDAYSKTSIPSFPPIPNSFASAVTMISTSSPVASGFSMSDQAGSSSPTAVYDQNTQDSLDDDDDDNDDEGKSKE